MEDMAGICKLCKGIIFAEFDKDLEEEDGKIVRKLELTIPDSCDTKRKCAEENIQDISNITGHETTEITENITEGSSGIIFGD
jgi:hypothetical protein